MADQEVIKHTKKIYKIWNSPEHGFWHKAKEFIIEIAIIVFAISLSIGFHNWSEERHQQQDVKEFLTGLKSDLQADLAEMADDKKSYALQKAAYTYVFKTKLNEKLKADSLNRYSNWLFNNTGLNPNVGRFEGFKSSGKIGTIEDQELQNDILDLYQENIPMLINTTNLYVRKKSDLYNFMQKNQRRLTDSTSNFAEILNTDEAHNICATLSDTEEILARYQSTIDKMKKIIASIDRHYPGKNN